MTYFTMRQVRLANKDAGYHFFDPSTIRFFHSRMGRRVYGGRYFVTSEQREYYTPRLYTVREAMEDGSIETVGKFQQYATGRQARRAIYKLTNGPVDSPETVARFEQDSLWDEHGNNRAGAWEEA